MKLFKWSEFLKEPNEDINSICKRYGIKNYTVKDGLVNRGAFYVFRGRV